MNKLVAFDLDGTLSESDLFLLPAYHHALTKMGKSAIPDEQLKGLIGGTAVDNQQLISPTGGMTEFREFERHIVQFVQENAAKLGRAYPHTAESLIELKRCGYKIVLCSNAQRSYSRLVLGKIGLLDYFDAVPESEDGWDKSRLLQQILADFHPDAAVMVGDRHFDQEAARANKLPFIGLAYGLFPAEIAEADAVIADADHLPDAVERLIGA